MKRSFTLIVVMVIFLSACASPAATTSVPVEQINATSTLPPAVVPVEKTATLIPEPTSTPTPVPPSPRWYWSVDDSDTAKVIAVNQFGERREIGTLDQADDLHTSAVSLDNERALLFLDSKDTLRVYLLTPDGMQRIKFPSEPVYFNADFSQPTRTVVGVYGDYAVFTYATTGAYQFQTVGAADTGPVFLVNLKTLTATLIDKEGNRTSLDANQAWFRTSKDGRYLRYINGNPDLDKMEIRELDMASGKVRTISTTKGAPIRIYPSPQGDLWYLRVKNIIIDLNGNQTDFADKEQMASPLRDGKVLVYSWNCVNNCKIKVFSPFGDDAALTYNLPWTIENSTSYVNVRQLLPDQSLLFAGMPYATLSKAPATVQTYPDLTKGDIPLFRLTPDGQARLVGIYVEGNFTSNVSANGQYILVQSIDHTSFFIYDAVADRPLFDIPIDTELEDHLATIRFFDTGILVNLTAFVPDTKHSVIRDFYYVYYHKTSTTLNWEDVNAEIYNCPDLIEDGTLICWFYQADASNPYLVRFDPAAGTKTVLLENGSLIEFVP